MTLKLRGPILGARSILWSFLFLEQDPRVDIDLLMGAHYAEILHLMLRLGVRKSFNDLVGWLRREPKCDPP